MTAQAADPVAEVPAQQPRRAYHYLITLQWQNDLGTRHASYGGVCSPSSPATRHELFAWVLETARTALSAPGQAVVVFLSIEPDEL